MHGGLVDDEVIRIAINITVLLAILMTPRGAGAEETAMVTEYTGAVNFERRGSMAPAAERAVLLLRFDVNEMIKATHEFGRFYGQANLKATVAYPLPREIEAAERTLMMLMELTSTGDKQERSVASWLAGALGLYNLFADKQLEQRLEHTIKAVRHTIHGVEALTNFTRTASEHITALEAKASEQRNMLQEVEIAQKTAAAWTHIEEAMEAFSRIAELALTHRASTAIERLVDMSDTWDNFVKQMEEAELIPVIDTWHQLFQCHVDTATDNGQFTLAIVVPATHQETVWMELMRWRARPIWWNGGLVEIQPQQVWIAVEVNSGASIPLNQEEVDGCTSIGRRVMCMGNLIQYTDHAGSCITALWMAEWEEAVKRCPMTTRPARIEAWPVRRGAFAMTSPSGSVVIVQCPGRTNQVLRVPSGMHLITLPSHCRATTAEWHTIADTEGEEARIVSFPVDMALMVGNLPDVKNKTPTDEAGGMSHPSPVVWQAEEAEEELRAAAPTRWLEWTALAIAVTACVAIVALATASYLTARFKPPGITTQAA